jgi:methylated-DNA-[protein]-cysteine S-methyltransferase
MTSVYKTGNNMLKEEENNTLVYKDMLSPVGKIRLIASEQGLAAIIWEGEDYKRTKLTKPVLDEQHPILLEAEKQLEEYFKKERKIFDLPIDFKGTDFQVKVWDAIQKIPFGKTKTYGELAQLLGDIKAVRAVGGALNKNPVSIIVPCHRVVGASGKLVGFARGLKNKSILLNLENDYKPLDLFSQTINNAFDTRSVK